MSTVAARKQATLLQTLVRRRHLTREQTIEVLDRRARVLDIRDFALSLRQLDRWLAGEIISLPRPSVCRVVEAEFEHPIEQLLAPCEAEGVAESALDTLTDVPMKAALRTEEMVEWLADHSPLEFTGAWQSVASEAARLEAEPRHRRADLVRRRGTIGRAAIAGAVAGYYGSDGLYRARVADAGDIRLSLLTRPEWTGLSLSLDRGTEDVRVRTDEGDSLEIAAVGTEAALKRLAAVETTETVMVNDLLYRLVLVDIGSSRMAVDFALADFAAYTLTNDLLEEELIDAVLSERAGMPLRDLYLPSLDAVFDVGGRLCVGGPACLTAIARPEGDYALLVQQRSSRVLNVAGRLSVIPKAFHQPIVDAVDEARISATVARELEEELLGRLDLEQIAPATRRLASPFHELNLSEPMAWLRANPAEWRLECTGFGINLVTGNYEFACLVIIEDPSWWQLHGHRVEANWETVRLRCISSRDTDSLARLVTDPNWSNEGLFALLEGLRRLAELGNDRVAIPTVEAVW